jgi:hypothetical protein
MAQNIVQHGDEDSGSRSFPEALAVITCRRLPGIPRDLFHFVNSQGLIGKSGGRNSAIAAPRRFEVYFCAVAPASW